MLISLAIAPDNRRIGNTMQTLNTYRSGPDEGGHFGIYGGRFVAETLMPLILEVERAYGAAKRDPDCTGTTLAPSISMRITLGCCRSTSTAPIYTTHSSPNRAHKEIGRAHV